MNNTNEILKYENLYNHLEIEFDTFISIIKHKIKKEIRKFSIQLLNIKAKKNSLKITKISISMKLKKSFINKNFLKLNQKFLKSYWSKKNHQNLVFYEQCKKKI